MLTHRQNYQSNIKSIKTTPGSVFNIIHTQSDDYYYSHNDNTANPIKIQTATLNDTANIFIPNGENNEYWAYNILCSRSQLHLCYRHQEIYHFDEQALSYKATQQYYINFHVLDNRWVVVFILSSDDKTIICRTHDLQKRRNSQTYSLAGLRVNSADCIYTYSVDNKIIIITPQQIALLGIQPDCGYSFTRLDFKQVPNPIIIHDIKWFSSQIIVKKVRHPTNSITNQQAEVNEHIDTHQGQFLNIYSQNTYRSHSEYSINYAPLLLGTINFDTLDIKCYYSHPKIPALMEQQLIKEPDEFLDILTGIFEYLAPDIIIHRPDVSKLTQYLSLLVPTAQDGTTPPKLIIMNIHEFEPKKEQRKYMVVDMIDDGRLFTIIYTKFQDDTWSIYRVDRTTRTIIHMVVPKPPKSSSQDIHIEIQSTGLIRIYKFNILRETIRTICPSTTNLVMLLDKISEPAAYLISKFAKQKIINY
jgi:hypothetical protein